VKELDRDDPSLYVHPGIAVIATGAGLLDMTRTAAAILLAERLTGSILVLDHGPILIDGAAEFTVA
jgi:hypothetical protein